jgi:cytochrome c oxidase subunit IV
MDNKKSAALQQGVFVFSALAVLTAAEYWIGVSTDMAALIFVLFLVKAALVINFYMHISRLFSPEEEGGH